MNSYHPFGIHYLPPYIRLPSQELVSTVYITDDFGNLVPTPGIYITLEAVTP